MAVTTKVSAHEAAQTSGPYTTQGITSSRDSDATMHDASVAATQGISVGDVMRTEGGIDEVEGRKANAEDAKHIRDDLAAILNGDIDFKGAFSFHRTYADAPNPVLRLSDIGVVGLPLSPREAEIVKSRCTQAPFGKGERTLIDKSVRDTWEMDASLVNFGNPRWSQFLSRVVKEICETLGVNFLASLPRCELYKLLLYEPGSHFLPHVDTEK